MAISGGPQAPQDGDLWRPWPRIPLRRLPPWGAWGPPEIAILDPPGGLPPPTTSQGPPQGGVPHGQRPQGPPEGASAPPGGCYTGGSWDPPRRVPRGPLTGPRQGALIHG